ncbi:MAG: TMEM175 family protein [Caulobacteraceae bacterium]
MASDDTSGAERGLGRIEGFADAVFAISITLLVVEIHPPGTFGGPPETHGLVAALLGEWRAYLGLAMSYGVIGLYWLRHHYSGRIYVKSDHIFSFLTLVFLAGVMCQAYPIRLWTGHLGRGVAADGRAAAIFLAWSLLVPGLGWLAKWLYALQGRRLMDERLESGFLRQMTIHYSASAALLAAGALISLLAPLWGLALGLAVTAAYVLPPPRPRYVGADPGPEES